MKKNIGLILLCVVIVIGSLFIGKNGEFNGADGEIEVKIAELNGDYQPWAEPTPETTKPRPASLCGNHHQVKLKASFSAYKQQ